MGAPPVQKFLDLPMISYQVLIKSHLVVKTLIVPYLCMSQNSSVTFLPAINEVLISKSGSCDTGIMDKYLLVSTHRKHWTVA